MENHSELLLSSVTCVSFVVYLIDIEGAAVMKKKIKTNYQTERSQESECTMVRLNLSRCTVKHN